MRTLVASDLHLGSAKHVDVLRHAGPLAALTAAAAEADRVVLLGDMLELRHGPLRDPIAAARPVLRALGEALGPDGELVLVPGNHDHTLLAPWLEVRGGEEEPAPLSLEEHAGPTPTRALAELAACVGPARFDVVYPGLWLRPDVYATHGHYVDRLLRLPTIERLAAGVMGRLVGPVPEAHAVPDDFEAALAPLYAWSHAVAQTKEPGFTISRQSASASTFGAVSGTGPRTLKARATKLAFPVAVAALNRAGLGPLRAQLSGAELRQAGLAAMGEVVRRLDVDAAHVVFGHTHRAGPLPGDDLAEWTAPGGARLHNCGCWTREPNFAIGGPESPYWAGRAIVVEDDGPPRLVRLVTELE